ncbi:MAG: hypothetical protein ACP6KW_11810 [Candidatus Thorarchaeota archaeon]
MGCGPRTGKRRRKRTKTQVASTGSRTHQIEGKRGSTLVIPRVPEKCDNCGAHIDQKSVKWTGPTSYECPYCGAVSQVDFQRVF